LEDMGGEDVVPIEAFGVEWVVLEDWWWFWRELRDRRVRDTLQYVVLPVGGLPVD